MINMLLDESRSGYSASYAYDANGNHASRTVNGMTETYTVDCGVKLTQVSLGGVASKTLESATLRGWREGRRSLP
jgi:hypothetical protein